MGLESRIKSGLRNLTKKRHAEVQLDDEVRAYVDMVVTIFISICGGRKERPCSLPRSDSERTARGWRIPWQ
jgi:hypothetical protein